MEILKIPTSLGANCYIVYDDTSKDGIIIDPGADGERLIEIIEEKEIEINYIVLTHGHGDHIGGVEKLKEFTGKPVISHEDELELLANPEMSLVSLMGLGELTIKPDLTVKEGDTIDFGNLSGQIIHTPGHTSGGMCIKIDNYLFTGDTLFQGSVGRTDFPTGDRTTLLNSILDKIMILDDDTVILSGHGGETTVGQEKKYNPFL